MMNRNTTSHRAYGMGFQTYLPESIEEFLFFLLSNWNYISRNKIVLKFFPSNIQNDSCGEAI